MSIFRDELHVLVLRGCFYVGIMKKKQGGERVKIAVCDDDEAARERVCALLPGGQDAASVFSSGPALLSAVEDGAAFDLYLLDILMPGVNGMELACAIRRTDDAAAIIFLTSSPEFAVESYGVGALDYLLKPVTADKLTAALNKARLRADRQRSEELLLASGGKLRSIPRSAVVCVESLRNRLIYRLNTGETVECYGTIAEAREKLLSDARFLQPHRSYLVNMEYIRELGGSGIVLEGMKSPVPVPRAAAPALRAQYIEYMVHMAGGEKHGV